MVKFDKTRRQEAIRSISESVGQAVDFPPEHQVLAIVHGNDVVGGVIVIGSEVHVGTTKHIFMRPLIRELLGKILATYGVVTTKVRKTNTIGQRFVDRLGFEKTGDAGSVFTYELHRIRHA